MVKQEKPQEVVIVIDATDLIVGRLATRVAKEAMHGKTVRVINCEHAVISGTKTFIIGEWVRRFGQGVPKKGPFIDRFPDRMVRRIVRGMIAHHNPRGREAYSRIMCYISVPPEFKDIKAVTYEDAKVSKLPTSRYLTIGHVCKEMGGRWL